MNLKNYKDYAAFDYPSLKCPLHKLGDVVYKKDTYEIGVIIQIHSEGEYRTDMFGNCSLSEIKLATKKQVEKYRPNILNEGSFDFIKSVKECIEYTIAMFACDPIGFVDYDENDTVETMNEKVDKQYKAFRDLTRQNDVDFKDAVCSWSKGRTLYNRLK